MTNAINSNLLAQNVNKNLANASKLLAKASAMMSSGEKITKPSDDAAGLSVGTGLKTDVSTLRTALSSASQARSVLAIMDGALKEIGDILQRQKSLSVQSNAGSLSDLERGYLDLEFQKLVTEVDRLVTATNFNGLKLLDGSLSGGNNLKTDTSGSTATSSVAITMAAAGVNTVAGGLIINGVTFDFDANGNESLNNSGAIVLDQTLTGAQKAQKIADLINNLTVTIVATSTPLPQGSMSQEARDRLSDLTATVSGAVVTIASKDKGGAGIFTVTAGGVANVTDHITTVAAGDKSITVGAGAADTALSSHSSGSTSGSLGSFSVTTTGTMGHAILQTLSQTKASAGFTTIQPADLADGATVTVFGRQLTLKNNPTNTSTQIKRSTASDFQTLQNIATFLNNSNDSNISNFYFEVQQSGSNVQLKATARAATTFVNSGEIRFSATPTALDLTGGVANGIDTSHITDNTSFIGKISGLTATMAGSDRATLSVKIGDYIYQGEIADTTPGANTSIRLKSTDLSGKGGYFDIVMANGQGVSVASQTDADTLATRIDTAVKELTFYQNRKISTFNAKGTSIEETVVSMISKSFADTDVSSIDVTSSTASTTQDAKLTIKLKDGRVFENSSDLNEKVSKGQLIDLTNSFDTNEKISIIWGRNVDLADATSVNILKSDLLSAFSANKSGMDFQVGFKADQVISVQIDDASTKTLFDGKVLDVKSVDTAATSSSQLDAGINKLKSLRANVGSFQSRFDSAASNIETSIQNTDAARAVFLDADIPAASTMLALSQVMMQASISVLAQMNLLPQNLLKLIG